MSKLERKLRKAHADKLAYFIEASNGTRMYFEAKEILRVMFGVIL